LPTFAALVGGAVPTDRVIDGRDISSLLFDPQAPPVRTAQLYFSRAGHLDAIRDGDWKLFLGNPTERQQLIAQRGERAAPAHQPPLAPALFQLSVDPGEAHDVLTEHPDVAARLRREAEERLPEIRAHTRPAGKVTTPP
jgi:arylsulfatase A-like enzyme